MLVRNMFSIVTTMCALTLCASSVDLVAQQNEMIALPIREQVDVKNPISNEVASEDLEKDEMSSESGEVKKLGFNQNYDNQFLYRIHPNAYNFPASVTLAGDTIQLFDTSLWFVNPRDRYLVLSWASNDPIFIRPNLNYGSFASWFFDCPYPYVFQNRVTQDIVEVNLVAPPVDGYARIIVDMNRTFRWVLLNDGTTWEVDPLDYTFDKWKIGHILLTGVNNGWRTANYPHILINASIYKAPYSEADSL